MSTPGLKVTGTTAKGFVLLLQTRYWNVWIPDPQVSSNYPLEGYTYDEYVQNFTGQAISYLDDHVKQIAKDLGYSISSPSIHQDSYDHIHMDCVSDSSSPGSRHGTVFGRYGVTISASAILNSFMHGGTEVPRFWWFILMCEETCDVWVDSLAESWVWSDSFSPMCAIVVTMELAQQEGYTDLIAVTGAMNARMLSSPATQLLYGIQKTYGWIPFQRLFESVKLFGIDDWNEYDEPLRAAMICWFLSCGASNVDLLPQFNSVIQAYSGKVITDGTYAEAQAKFPDPAGLYPSPPDMLRPSPPPRSFYLLSIIAVTSEGKDLRAGHDVRPEIKLFNSAGKDITPGTDDLAPVTWTMAAGVTYYVEPQAIGGWEFAFWDDAESTSTSARRQVNLSADIILTAVYMRV